MVLPPQAVRRRWRPQARVEEMPVSAEPGADYNAARDVRHAGDATIIFDESRVVPLFQASLDGGVSPAASGTRKTVAFDWGRHARILLRVLDYGSQQSSRRQR